MQRGPRGAGSVASTETEVARSRYPPEHVPARQRRHEWCGSLPTAAPLLCRTDDAGGPRAERNRARPPNGYLEVRERGAASGASRAAATTRSPASRRSAQLDHVDSWLARVGEMLPDIDL